MVQNDYKSDKLDINKFVKKKVLLISLYGYQLFSIRVLHSIIEKYAQVKTVFFKELRDGEDMTPSEKEYALLMDLVKEFKPGIIGISFRSSYFSMTKEITRKIRKISDALIMWGGIHPILSPEECIDYADMVCICEGEIPIKNLFEKKSLDGFWVNYNGKIYKNPKRVLTENLDELPVPNFKNQNKYYIEGDKLNFGDPIHECRVYNIMASRGCPFNCSYCINSNLKDIYHGQKLLRLRSVDSVIDELKAIKNESKNLRRIFFFDEIFGLGNKEWMKEFVKRYKKEINLPFGLEYRPDMIKEDILRMLKDAGLDNMTIGLESGSERVRKEVYLRNISDEQMLKCQRILKKVGIIGTYNIIVKNPLETIEDLKKGFELIIKFPRPFSFHIYRLIHFPKTELTNKLLSEGIIKESEIDVDNTFILSKNNSEEDFWINMIGLSSKEFIPKKFLIFLTKKKYLIKHPFFIYSLTRVSNFAKFMIDGFRWASREGFSYGIMIAGFRNLKAYLRTYR